MPERLLKGFRPRFERLEAKETLSASTVQVAAGPIATGQTTVSAEANDVTDSGPQSIYMDRITNPTRQNGNLVGPFPAHVLVQKQQPVPGQVYNLTFISVFNGTKHTFTAADGITAKTSDEAQGVAFPVLTGNEVWAPGTRIILYLVTKKYYPLFPTQTAGFRFNFVHPTSTAIPGPSGIALRVKYNPATINSVLDQAVLSGPGAIGHQYGLPDTALYEIIPQPSKVIHL